MHKDFGGQNPDVRAGDGGHRYRCSDPAEIDSWRSVEAWFQSHPGENGCPLKTENKDAADQRKYVALSREEKEMLVDVASSVTISLRDAHGDILQAIRNSLTNRSVDITVG